MMNMILRFPVLVVGVMPHKSHHQDVRQRAEQDHRKEKYRLQWDIKQGNQGKSSDGDQAAGYHDQGMFFIHSGLQLGIKLQDLG